MTQTLTLEQLIERRQWHTLEQGAQIGAVYHFVKDEITFGYNRSDMLSAQEVLNDGYGQCNTKSNLLFALLSMLGFSVRFRGMRIDKALQKGAMPTWIYWLAPRRIAHSWVEVFYREQWIALEGVILDEVYLNAVQRKYADATNFCGYGIATTSLQSPKVQWCGQSTFIQKEGVVESLGIFETPDDFYRAYGDNVSGVRAWIYRHVIRHVMNWNVHRIRISQ